MKKRIFVCFAALLLCLVQMPIAALSMSDTEQPIARTMQGSVQTVQRDENPTVLYDSIDLAADAVAEQIANQSEEDLKKTILDGVSRLEESISLDAYRISAETLKAVIQDLMFSEPMLFHLESGYSYTLANNLVSEYKPKYKMNANAYAEAKRFCEEEIEKILIQSGALMVEDDLWQALLLNDYLASHYIYATTQAVFDIYGMLKDGKAVCQGYTLLYDALLTRCGIENGYAHSSAMNHIWNLVKIDGDYYHVDVTWADPISDKYSLVSHNYFMLSDAYIASTSPGTEHYDWITSGDITCTSTKYDDSIFDLANSPFVLCGNDLYYIDFHSGDLCRYIDPFTGGEILCSLADYWMVPGQTGAYYPGTYSGLVAVDANLYYNTPSGIGAYNLITNMKRTLYTLPQGEGQIVGLVLSADRTLSYAVADSVTSPITRIGTNEIVPLHACDVNRDGILNIEDVTSILKFLSGADENPLCRPDTNLDGIYNVDDLNTLLITLSTIA